MNLPKSSLGPARAALRAQNIFWCPLPRPASIKISNERSSRVPVCGARRISRKGLPHSSKNASPSGKERPKSANEPSGFLVLRQELEATDVYLLPDRRLTNDSALFSGILVPDSLKPNMLDHHDVTIRVRYAETDQMGVVYHSN